VETEADFIASLKKGGFDLILADYTLSSFDGLSALKDESTSAEPKKPCDEVKLTW
jgi:hypothetical protein